MCLSETKIIKSRVELRIAPGVASNYHSYSEKQTMEKIIDKLTTYNIFNYLLPGIIFVVLFEYFLEKSLIIENNFIGAFLYYFIGMTISRIGSLIIAPIIRWTKLIKYAKYKDYVPASSKDSKIELLSEVNNMYRTFMTLFFVLLFAKLYFIIETKFGFSTTTSKTLLIIGLTILYIFSYKKQTSFVKQRVDANK